MSSRLGHLSRARPFTAFDRSVPSLYSARSCSDARSSRALRDSQFGARPFLRSAARLRRSVLCEPASSLQLGARCKVLGPHPRPRSVTEVCRSFFGSCLIACLPACLLACLFVYLLACSPACLLVCVSACLLAGSITHLLASYLVRPFVLLCFALLCFALLCFALFCVLSALLLFVVLACCAC